MTVGKLLRSGYFLGRDSTRGTLGELVFCLVRYLEKSARYYWAGHWGFWRAQTLGHDQCLKMHFRMSFFWHLIEFWTQTKLCSGPWQRQTYALSSSVGVAVGSRRSCHGSFKPGSWSAGEVRAMWKTASRIRVHWGFRADLFTSRYSFNVETTSLVELG